MVASLRNHPRKVRKRAKGVAAILNSVENLEQRIQLNVSKQEKEQRKIQKKN